MVLRNGRRNDQSEEFVTESADIMDLAEIARKLHGVPGHGPDAWHAMRERVEALECRAAVADTLLMALQSMCSVWVTVCHSQGWEPDHMSQYINARAAIAAASIWENQNAPT